MISRRTTVKTFAGTAAMAAMGAGAARAADKAVTQSKKGEGGMKIICVEEHIIDPDIARATMPVLMHRAPYTKDWGYVPNGGSGPEEQPASFQGDRPYPLFRTALGLARDSGAARIAEMDRHGIDMQILSYSNPLQLASGGEAVALARAANDRIGSAIRANPARFGGFCALPWQHPKEAADELDRTVHELGLSGVMLIGNPSDSFLDDPAYAPVLAKLDALKVPIYVHPGTPMPQVQSIYYAGLAPAVSARLSTFGWGWHNEAGVHVIRMMLSGVFDKFPNLRVISGHWGEMVPFYLQRMEDMIPPDVSGLSRTITDTYREHVFVTPSGMLNVPHFDFIHTVLGAERIIYSVDYPYLSNTGARAFLETLSIDQAAKEKIAHGNIEALMSPT